LSQLAKKLRNFLSRVFEGAVWPALRITEEMIDECYEDFAGVLREALQGAEGGAVAKEASLAAMATLTTDLMKDPRLPKFFAHIRAAVDPTAEEG